MPTDDIQEEVWANREALGAQFGYDLHAIVRYLNEKYRDSGWVVLQPPPHPDVIIDASGTEPLSEAAVRG